VVHGHSGRQCSLSQLLRDTLLSLAVERLFHARWSATIHDEWTRNLVKDRPDMASKLPAVVALMNASVPDCLVTHYEKLADSIELPDPDDRHVVAAAIEASQQAAWRCQDWVGLQLWTGPAWKC
jgi:PIN domain